MLSARRLVQAGFLALTVAGVFLLGGHAERWCPFGGAEAIYTYVREGNLTCSLGVSNFYVLGAVLLSALLLRRAFCGYVCPIGAISEFARRGAALLGIREMRVPRRLDAALSLLKYPVLAAILYLTWKAGELIFRGFDPCYALISRHGEDITFWAYVAAGGILAGSLFLSVPFCRWICPLAALLNPLSRFGLARVRRDEAACIDCGKCARACPMAIPVDRVPSVAHARCTACLDCLAVCPEIGRGALAWGAAPGIGARRRPGGASPARGRVLAAGLMVLLLASSVAATVLFPLPSFAWSRGVAPERTATLELAIAGVTCRGSSNRLAGFLDRDDEYAVPGYLKLETWPGPGFARVRLTYDPAATNGTALRQAATEAYFDAERGEFRIPPFRIAGYDPLDSSPGLH